MTPPRPRTPPQARVERAAAAAAFAAATVTVEKVAVPWEQPDRPRLARFFGTLRLLGRMSPRFFYSLEPGENSGAEWFAYIVCFIGFAGYFGGELLLFRDSSQALSDAFAQAVGTGMTAPTPEGITRFFTYGLYASPLLAILPVHICAGLYQFGLSLLGLPSRGFTVTFRVAAYGLAPVMLLAIPGIGILLAPGWILALHWIGISAAHRIPPLLGAMAIALPLLGFFVIFATIAGRLLLAALGTPAP